MVALINLPTYRPSPLLDTSGINQALASRDQAAARNAAMALDQQRWQASNALAQGQFGLAQRAAERQDQLAPEELALRRAQAANARGELANLPYRAKLLQAQTARAEAEAKAAQTKDEQTAAIAELIRGPGARTSPPPQQAPMLQPQSFEGGPGGAPMLIQTQAAAQGNQPAQPDMVNTPLGTMPLDVAKRRALGLSLAGKGDAGKMLLDEANADKLGKTAQGEVEKDLVGLTGTIGRLESLTKRFDPEFLKIPERAGFAWSGLKEKFGTLPPDQQKALASYTRFRQTSINNAALYVKYLSGVAVSTQEFQRIMKTLPNAGSGIFDGDSPTEYASKMQEAIVQSKMAVARAMHLKRDGFKGKPWEAGIALDDMRGIIDQRGAQIEQQLQGRVAPDKMRGVVRQQLKREFGI